MSLISKKPSAVLHVLCATQCPPCNILHEIDDYASFYDPCYYPHFYASVFAMRESTCVWLLNGLQTHSVCCEQHLQSFSHVVVTTDETLSSPAGFFHCFLDGVHLCVPFVYIESSLMFINVHCSPSVVYSAYTICFLQNLNGLLQLLSVVNNETECCDRGA